VVLVVVLVMLVWLELIAVFQAQILPIFFLLVVVLALPLPAPLVLLPGLLPMVIPVVREVVRQVIAQPALIRKFPVKASTVLLVGTWQR
tara:strand:- start:384 stop:650 length:267 start_codon:yes stop_codon:yes gene_type:complete